MIENIVFMQVEDNIASFERSNGDIIYLPMHLIPSTYSQGDILRVVFYGSDFIEFLEIDAVSMALKRSNTMNKKSSLRERARRSTNNA